MPCVTSLWGKAVPPGCLLSLRDSDRQESSATAYPWLAPVGLTRPKNVLTALLLSEGPPARAEAGSVTGRRSRESLPTVHSTLLTISSHRHQCLTRVVTKQQDSLPWVYIPGSDVGPRIVTSHEPSGRGAGISVTAPADGSCQPAFSHSRGDTWPQIIECQTGKGPGKHLECSLQIWTEMNARSLLSK